MSYHDDNFGKWRIESDEDLEWYHEVQARSVEKTCAGCGARVKILPHYAYCNSCADIIERGGELPGAEPRDVDGWE